MPERSNKRYQTVLNMVIRGLPQDQKELIQDLNESEIAYSRGAIIQTRSTFENSVNLLTLLDRGVPNRFLWTSFIQRYRSLEGNTGIGISHIQYTRPNEIRVLFIPFKDRFNEDPNKYIFCGKQELATQYRLIYLSNNDINIYIPVTQDNLPVRYDYKRQQVDVKDNIDTYPHGIYRPDINDLEELARDISALSRENLLEKEIANAIRRG